MIGSTIWRLKRSSSNRPLTLNRKDSIYFSTNREHFTFQVYSYQGDNKETRYLSQTKNAVFLQCFLLAINCLNFQSLGWLGYVWCGLSVSRLVKVNVLIVQSGGLPIWTLHSFMNIKTTVHTFRKGVQLTLRTQSANILVYGLYTRSTKHQCIGTGGLRR